MPSGPVFLCECAAASADGAAASGHGRCQDPPSTDSDPKTGRPAITDRQWSSSRSEGPSSGRELPDSDSLSSAVAPRAPTGPQGRGHRCGRTSPAGPARGGHRGEGGRNTVAGQVGLDDALRWQATNELQVHGRTVHKVIAASVELDGSPVRHIHRADGQPMTPPTLTPARLPSTPRRPRTQRGTAARPPDLLPAPWAHRGGPAVQTGLSTPNRLGASDQ